MFEDGGLTPKITEETQTFLDVLNNMPQSWIGNAPKKQAFKTYLESFADASVDLKSLGRLSYPLLDKCDHVFSPFILSAFQDRGSIQNFLKEIKNPKHRLMASSFFLCIPEVHSLMFPLERPQLAKNNYMMRSEIDRLRKQPWLCFYMRDSADHLFQTWAIFLQASHTMEAYFEKLLEDNYLYKAVREEFQKIVLLKEYSAWIEKGLFFKHGIVSALQAMEKHFEDLHLEREASIAFRNFRLEQCSLLIRREDTITEDEMKVFAALVKEAWRADQSDPVKMRCLMQVIGAEASGLVFNYLMKNPQNAEDARSQAGLFLAVTGRNNSAPVDDSQTKMAINLFLDQLTDDNLRTLYSQEPRALDAYLENEKQLSSLEERQQWYENRSSALLVPDTAEERKEEEGTKDQKQEEPFEMETHHEAQAAQHKDLDQKEPSFFKKSLPFIIGFSSTVVTTALLMALTSLGILVGLAMAFAVGALVIYTSYRGMQPTKGAEGGHLPQEKGMDQNFPRDRGEQAPYLNFQQKAVNSEESASPKKISHL
jgi:hypothetical protein